MELDATSLIDVERLQAEVTAMYRDVARGDDAGLHFEIGRPLAERLGYPARLLDAIPAEALTSFAGVGHHLDLAALRPGEAVLDLGRDRHGRLLRGHARRHIGPCRRHRHDRRPGRQGLALHA